MPAVGVQYRWIDPEEYIVTQFPTRFASLSAAAIAAVFLLAACGPKSPSEPAAGPSSPAADAAQNDAKAQELAAREKELADREAAMKAQEEAAQKQKEAEEQARLDSEKAKAEQEAAAKAAAAKKSTATKTAATGGTTAKPAEAPKPIVVPTGTSLAIALDSALTTKTAQAGDRVSGKLTSDVVVDGRKAASSGAAVTGSVYKVISGSDRIGTTPKLVITFDSLVASNGATTPIAARYQVLGKSEKGKDTAKIVGGAAAGAIIGNQVSNKGGAVVGGLAGAGVGAVVADKTGNEVEVAAGTVITAATTAEFQVKPK
jgi:FKBP-type peptidyl-prolyl cis-trans isomerase